MLESTIATGKNQSRFILSKKKEEEEAKRESEREKKLNIQFDAIDEH
jgi:hypothetical protein